MNSFRRDRRKRQLRDLVAALVEQVGADGGTVTIRRLPDKTITIDWARTSDLPPFGLAVDVIGERAA